MRDLPFVRDLLFDDIDRYGSAREVEAIDVTTFRTFVLVQIGSRCQAKGMVEVDSEKVFDRSGAHNATSPST